MRHLFLLGFLALSGALPLYGYTDGVTHVVEQLRHLKDVGGDAVGYAGTPHGFYLLYGYCYQTSTDEDLLEMIKDPSPVVRIMGAKCIVTGTWRKIDKNLLKELYSDIAKLDVGPGGCIFQTMCVSDVVYAMMKDPNYLGRSAGLTRR